MPEAVGGRQTARRMDVYFTETARGCALSATARGRSPGAETDFYVAVSTRAHPSGAIRGQLQRA